jgi:4-amino-4-deoxy-L-arabinose transferase-like glycosyltransferase
MRRLHVPTARASTWPAVVVAASVLGAVVLRVPFMRTGLGPDEGGYAYVADQWARGARLYGPSAWVDRPQGLLLVYRGLLSIAHGPWAVRLGAVVFGAAITLLLGAIGWMLKGAWTGAAAAAIYAVVGVAPHVQGFTFNGELAAALPTAGSIAAALAWRKTRGTAWLVGAGLCGGAALLMKQSGFDGLLVAAGVVYSVRPRRWRTGATFAAAAAVPPALSALHGLSVGWSNYWFAVAWYKLDAHSGVDASLSGRLGRLATSWLGARRDLELLVLVALAGVGCALLRRPPLWLPVGWLLAAFIGFNAASLYWPHYYVQLLAPLALLAGIAATSVPARPSVRVLVVAVAVWQVLPYLIRLDEMPPSQRQALVPYFHQYVSDERVARAVRASTGLHDSIYALDSEADLYLLADRRAAFPYLWAHPLEEIPGAMGRLRALLDGKGRPRLVIVYRRPTVVDPSGRLGRILHDDYRVQERVPSADATILRSSTA